MSAKKDIKFTPQEMRQLLKEIDQLDEEVIIPLSEEEVAEIEAAYQSQGISTKEQKQPPGYLEELRQEWIADSEEITGLFHQARRIGLAHKDFAQKLHLGLDVLFKLDRRLIEDVPNSVFHRLADILKVDIQSIYRYLIQPPQNLDQMAASSRDKPAASRIQSWEEAISTSNMPEVDKEFWLR